MHHTRSATLVVAMIGLLGGALAEGAGPEKGTSAAHEKGSQRQPAVELAQPAVSRSEPDSNPAVVAAATQPEQRSQAQATESREISTTSSAAIASNAPVGGKAAPAERNEAADPLALNVLVDDELATQRGGTQTLTLTLNKNTLSGPVTDNVAQDLTTGTNSISTGSFSNSSGMPMVIQNSGNNVSIQNSTILNMQLK